MKRIAHKPGNRSLAALALVLGLAGLAGAQAPATPPLRRILVSIPDRKLAVLENDRVLRTFAVAVGAEGSPSPLGEFQVVRRLTNPAYYHPGVVIPPGADNPLGPRWIGLSEKGFGILGTNQPLSVGYAKSHGCVRLKNADIIVLFEMIRVGDTVEIHADRNLLVTQVFGGVESAQNLNPASSGSGN
jgi:L,D-transpeptidase ErfK/SrfK